MEKEVRAGETVVIKENGLFFEKGTELKIDEVTEEKIYLKQDEINSIRFQVSREDFHRFLELKQPKDPNELIGRKVKGFRFEDTESGIVFPEQMNELIGFKGEILRLTLDEDGYVVSFKKPYHCEFTYPADQIEQHLLPEKKTKKERIEELEKRVEQLESDFKDFCSYVEFKILEPDSSEIQKQNLEDDKSMVNDKNELWKFFVDEHNLTLLDSEIEDIIHEVNKYQQQKQAPEFWYIDIQEEKDSELLPKFKEWFVENSAEEWMFNSRFYGKSCFENDNSSKGYQPTSSIEQFHNSDKMQKITLNEWNNWFNK